MNEFPLSNFQSLFIAWIAAGKEKLGSKSWVAKHSLMQRLRQALGPLKASRAPELPGKHDLDFTAKKEENLVCLSNA